MVLPDLFCSGLGEPMAECSLQRVCVNWGAGRSKGAGEEEGIKCFYSEWIGKDTAEPLAALLLIPFPSPAC